MRQTIEDLRKQQASYAPNDSIKESLSQKTMVFVIGPTATGKTTCIDLVTEHDSEFARVHSFTTRPKRTGEPENLYRYIPHNPEGIKQISAKVENKELVQYAIPSNNDHIYGSELADYGASYMILDTLSTAVAQMEKLPFKKIVRIALACPPDQWRKQLSERADQLSEPVVEKRLTEAKESIEWSLGQEANIAWVNNPIGKADVAAREIIDIARGGLEPNPLNRELGMKMLGTLNEFSTAFKKTG